MYECFPPYRHVYVYVHLMHDSCQTEVRRQQGIPWNQIIQLLTEYWELNQGLLKNQQELFNAESSL